MDIKNLIPVALTLILSGLLLGVGIVVLDSLATQAVTHNTITTAYVSGTKLPYTYSSATSYNNWVLTRFYNSTVEGDITADLNWTAAGAITMDGAHFSNGTDYIYNITFTGDTNTSAVDTAYDVINDSLAPIASNWFSLIITVAVLSIILWLVVTSFVGGLGKGR